MKKQLNDSVGRNMIRVIVECRACRGRGKWTAPAVAGEGVHYERQDLVCLSCEGTGKLRRFVIDNAA